jgi:glycerophosphoryl diester phosphodiesterase
MPSWIRRTRSPGRALLGSALAVLVGALAVIAPPPASAAASCLFAAHRGYTAHATENGMHAMQYAINRGADYLEMDVQVARNGRFVLMHDKTVDRTTDGTGRIIDKSWSQLSRMRLNDGEPLAALNDVLAMVKSSGVQILLEMKWIPTSRFAALHRLVEDYGDSKVVVHSFSHYVVRKYRSMYPHARTGVDVTSRISVADARSFGGVLPDYRHASDQWLRNLRNGGVPTYLSTLNTLEAWQHYSGKVTLIVTDRAVDYDAYRDQYCG